MRALIYTISRSVFRIVGEKMIKNSEEFKQIWLKNLTSKVPFYSSDIKDISDYFS